MKAAFQYATVELMPYPDLGEFVIIGIVAVDVGRTIRAKILEPRKTKRLTHFFPEVERKVFTQTLANLKDEIEGLVANINGGNDRGFTPTLDFEEFDAKAIFQVLTTSREGMVRIRPRGVATTDHFDAWIEEAYERFVMRVGEETLDPAERVLTNQIRDLLVEWRVAKMYKQTQVGERHFHAVFPFAYTPEGENLPVRAIKPLHLAHNSPTKILDHGDRWLQKIRRLRQFKNLPEQVVFPIQLPEANGDLSGERAEVADCLISDFRKEGIEIVTGDGFRDLRKSVYVDADQIGGLFS